MALATVADVEARFKSDDKHLATDDADWTESLLDEASDIALAEMGCDPTDADTGITPEPVVRAVARMVKRVLERAAQQTGVPLGATQVQQTVGPFNLGATFGNGGNSTSPWLEKPDRAVFAKYGCNGKAFAVDTAPAVAGYYGDAPWWGGVG